jgi:hypothetical protein
MSCVTVKAEVNSGSPPAIKLVTLVERIETDTLASIGSEKASVFEIRAKFSINSGLN